MAASTPVTLRDLGGLAACGRPPRDPRVFVKTSEDHVAAAGDSVVAPPAAGGVRCVDGSDRGPVRADGAAAYGTGVCDRVVVGYRARIGRRRQPQGRLQRRLGAGRRHHRCHRAPALAPLRLRTGAKGPRHHDWAWTPIDPHTDGHRHITLAMLALAFLATTSPPATPQQIALTMPEIRRLLAVPAGAFGRAGPTSAVGPASSASGVRRTARGRHPDHEPPGQGTSLLIRIPTHSETNGREGAQASVNRTSFG